LICQVVLLGFTILRRRQDGILKLDMVRGK